MKQIFVGSRVLRLIKCDGCGMNISYNKKKGQTEIVCPRCSKTLSLKIHKY